MVIVTLPELVVQIVTTEDVTWGGMQKQGVGRAELATRADDAKRVQQALLEGFTDHFVYLCGGYAWALWGVGKAKNSLVPNDVDK